MKRFVPIFVLVALILFVPTAPAETINIAAAISMKEALIDANVYYNKLTGEEVEFSFGASGVLLTQIKNGAPIDGFISASAEQVDALESAHLTVPGSRRIVVRNELVMIVPAASTLKLTSIASLTRDDVKKIAIGQPKSVPAGAYAMQSLAALKLDTALAGKIVNGANVRQVLDYVQRGEVDAGFVYATDAQQAGIRVKIIATAPAESHDEIVYPGVVIAASKNHEAVEQFFAFLASPKGLAIFRNRGFVTEAPTTKPTTLPATAPARAPRAK
ncbi:molybdate ABC transporter substrate-binding protein [soil metagenome]